MSKKWLIGLLGFVMGVSLFASQDSVNKYDWQKYAKTTIDVMNKNWYSKTFEQWMEAGKEETGENCLSAWHSFNILEQLIDYKNLTGDKSLDKLINTVAYNSQLNAQSVLNGNDDMEWEAIALSKMYQINKDPKILFEVKEIFKKMDHHYWDDHCNGGVYWQPEKQYKNAITNELYLVLATKLYFITNDEYYKDWALKEWNWLNNSGMINKDNLVNDGLDNKTCKNNNGTTWTYNQGVILGGLADLYLITKDEKYLTQANKIADAVIKNLTKDGILVEPGTIDDSRKQFKGIFMRYLAYLAVHEVDHSVALKYKEFILNNAEYVWKNRGKGNQFSYYWQKPDTYYDAITQSSVFDLFNAAILVSSKIK